MSLPSNGHSKQQTKACHLPVLCSLGQALSVGVASARHRGGRCGRGCCGGGARGPTRAAAVGPAPALGDGAVALVLHVGGVVDDAADLE